MFCWCYYAHITRIARSSPLRPVGLVPEREREGGREGERKEEEAKKTCQKTAAWQSDRFPGFIQGGEGGGRRRTERGDRRKLE